MSTVDSIKFRKPSGNGILSDYITTNNNTDKYSYKRKENIYKRKCYKSKELKRKLKKYKLRRDGEEDPEVLNVSQILVSALKIKSPNHKELDESEEVRPRNYLFKMGRKKQIVAKPQSQNGTARIAKSKECEFEPKTLTESKNIISNEVLKERNEMIENNSQSEKDKSETNAFKLMMESRNKSIGNNSSGKEKVLVESEMQDTIEKRNIKAKNTLLLQKMAESKGAQKKKELEDYQEQIIKKKMEKRAERLKNMIQNHDTGPKLNNKKDMKEKSVSKNNLKNNKETALAVKKIKLVDIFENSPTSLKKSVLPKEDDDFLKKLSPSLRKKENMLCYFNKIDKEDTLDYVSGDSKNAVDDGNIIKVKLTTKIRKKKKKKLSLVKDQDNCPVVDTESFIEIKNETVDIVPPEEHIKLDVKHCNGKKRTNKAEDNLKHIASICVCTEAQTNRPRRSVKRPAKYIDELKLSSSDEELHIFTPKKKKHAITEITLDCNTETKPISSKPIKKNKSCTDVVLKKKGNDNNNKKNTKLAPIFNVKAPLDAKALEAKQRFLSSGVPDTIKKVIEKRDHKNQPLNNFHTVVHVQQSKSSLEVISIPNISLRVDSDDDEKSDIEKENFKMLLNLKTGNKTGSILNINNARERLDNKIVLQNLKQYYPKFPVYRTYRMLKDKSKGEFRDCSILDLDNSIEVINGMFDINIDSPERLNWTDKYKPMSSKQIIGNFNGTKELQKWLVSWTENNTQPKKQHRSDSDSSDFYLSDTDSKDSMKSNNNLFIVSGPVGSGKTAMVYAVAAELSIKVLEVNASSKRTGKIMLQDLHEATQSHKVNRGLSGSQDNSQKLQNAVEVEVPKINKEKKRGRPKKIIESTTKTYDKIYTSSQPNSQDSTKMCMSLILIDDADIVFDQDDGFSSAIVQLVHYSKRPVILITTSTTCPHLQRFLHIAKIIETRPFLPRMLGTWLDIMCLAENNICWPGLGAKFLDYFKGDIRRTINYLQFFLLKDHTAQNESVLQGSEQYKVNMEDESSNMSWSDREAIDNNENREADVHINSKSVDDIWRSFMNNEASMNAHSYPIKLFNMWWDLPRLLNPPSGTKSENEKKTDTNDTQELKALSDAMEMISLADCFRQSHLDTSCALTDLPWQNIYSDSVSEQENFENYNRTNEVTDKIGHSLVAGSIANSRRKLDNESGINLNVPSTTVKREKDRIIARHNSLTNYLNASAVLDRRALALDYWPSCRSICRLEKMKTDTNSKRNNRFCHYLKSLNVLCSNDSLDKLGNSLQM